MFCQLWRREQNDGGTNRSKPFTLFTLNLCRRPRLEQTAAPEDIWLFFFHVATCTCKIFTLNALCVQLFRWVFDEALYCTRVAAEDGASTKCSSTRQVCTSAFYSKHMYNRSLKKKRYKSTTKPQYIFKTVYKLYNCKPNYIYFYADDACKYIIVLHRCMGSRL